MKHTEKPTEVKQSCKTWQVLISASCTHQAELELGKVREKSWALQKGRILSSESSLSKAGAYS